MLAISCGLDDAPFEQLPAPPRREVAPLPPPPPPPPPSPKGGSPVGPPEAVRAFLTRNAHHERPCRTSLAVGRRASELDAAHAEQLFERLGRTDTWTDGVNGCVSQFVELRIWCRAGEPPLQLRTTCGNVWVGGTELTWSTEMDAWFRTLLPSS